MNKIITPSTAQLRMLASIRSQQWMIRPDAVQDYALSALEAAEKSGTADMVDREYLSLFYTLRSDLFIDADGIAHIDVRGALLNKCPLIYEIVGLATRYQTIISEIGQAREMNAKGIIIYMDSPGGTVAGVVEAGEAISNAGVPVVAFCQGMACSACYWLASGATQIIATPSATVGNVGAILSWMDCTEFWASQGIEFKALVSEGAELKSTFHLEPDESQLAFLQESIDEAGRAFREHVSEGRAKAGATLDPEVFRAGWYSGAKAGTLGLVDGFGSGSDAKDAIMEIINQTQENPVLGNTN